MTGNEIANLVADGVLKIIMILAGGMALIQLIYIITEWPEGIWPRRKKDS